MSYCWKAFHCELCKGEYDEKLIINGREHHLFVIEKPKSNYVILESIQLQNASQ